MSQKKSKGKSKGKSKANTQAKVQNKTQEKTELNIEAAEETAPVAAAETKPAKKSEAKPAAKKSQSKKINPVVKYFRDLKSEFKKVVWPSKKTVVNNTGVVLTAMIISGLALWGIDSGFAALLRGLLSLAG